MNGILLDLLVSRTEAFWQGGKNARRLREHQAGKMLKNKRNKKKITLKRVITKLRKSRYEACENKGDGLGCYSLTDNYPYLSSVQHNWDNSGPTNFPWGKKEDADTCPMSRNLQGCWRHWFLSYLSRSDKWTRCNQAAWGPLRSKIWAVCCTPEDL